MHFEGQGDDCTNVHGVFHDVRRRGAAQFELGSRPAGGVSVMNIGGRYEFRNRNNWTVEGVGVCTATSVAAGKQYASFDWEAGSAAAESGAPECGGQSRLFPPPEKDWARTSTFYLKWGVQIQFLFPTRTKTPPF